MKVSEAIKASSLFVSHKKVRKFPMNRLDYNVLGDNLISINYNVYI